MPLTTSANGLAFIEKWEGCVLTVYKDSVGLPTIGIGHLIKKGETFSKISREKALQLLAEDVKGCENAINKFIKVPLNQNQFDALVSWSFNCGIGVLQTSTLSKRLNLGFYDEVPSHLANWCKGTVNGKKVVIKGLLLRRQAEGALWKAPVQK